MIPSIEMSRVDGQWDACPYLRVRVVNLRDIELAYGLDVAIAVRRELWTRLSLVGGPDIPVWRENDVLTVSLGYAAQTWEGLTDGSLNYELSQRTALSMPIEITPDSWVCPLIATELLSVGAGRPCGAMRPGVDEAAVPGEEGISGEPARAGQFRDDMAKASYLLESLRTGQLPLAFQSVVHIQDLSSVLYDELLLRPAVGGPGQIAVALERLGIAWLLDRSVVWTAIEVLEAHPARHLACNVSAFSFHPDPWWFEVMDFLQSRPSVAARLIIEITETGVLRDLRKALGLILRLRKAGVRVALDDVGVGNCTLAFLLEASPCIIKIDRLMLQRAAQSKEGGRQFQALIKLCASCSPCVVVEGIENEAELNLARAGGGVSAVQGFAIAMPDRAPSWLNCASQFVSLR
jgi:EAL domain-containing protein (putative c-di-GMP-specific phosphodiesterase class I)